MSELDPTFVAEARHSSSSEVPLHVSELFFSRTNERAIIENGNAVFRRVSGLEWGDLIGAPHKIVRHPDMPRGVFQYVWDRLKSGEVFGGYVKNRDQSGRYYWVFSLVSPVPGGYLSIRLKPTSGILQQMIPVYEDLLRRESEEGLSPSDSAAAMVEKVMELGYSSYTAFQSAALATEFASRAKSMGNPLDQMQKRFLDMSKSIQQVRVETSEMTESFKAIRTVPMNMRIIASRLESAGGPISAISVNYSQMLEEMSTWVKTFVQGDECVFALIRNAILKSQFLGFSSALVSEMVEALESGADSGAPGLDFRNDIEMLESLRKAFHAETTAALTGVEAEAMRLGRSVLDMKRYVTGLSSTRMMCKIESASLSNSGTALSGIVDQLDACQDEIEERLSRIVELNSVIQSNTAMLRSFL